METCKLLLVLGEQRDGGDWLETNSELKWVSNSQNFLSWTASKHVSIILHFDAHKVSQNLHFSLDIHSLKEQTYNC